MSYKPGVGDLRESPALKIMGILEGPGRPSPITTITCRSCPNSGSRPSRSSGPWEGADVAVILTAHPGLDVDAVVRDAPLVVDFRGVTRGIEAPNLIRL